MIKKALAIGLTFSLVLSAAPAFAQGRGAGAGAGGNGRVQTPAGQAGVKTDTDVKGKTSTEGTTKEGKQAGTSDKSQAESSVATKIQANTALNTKVSALLPTGVSLSDAAADFKNQGQFIAALHVSKNLNIPFDQLKAKMTGSDSMSLGAAIKASRPEMSDQKANEEAKKAEKEAKETEKK